MGQMSTAREGGQRERSGRVSRPAIVAALLVAGVWLAVSSGTGLDGDGTAPDEDSAGRQAAEDDAAESPSEGAPALDDVPGAGLAERHEWPRLSLLLTDDHRLTRIDLPEGHLTGTAIDELAGGDPPFRLTRQGEAVAFHGQGGTYAMHPAAPEDAWRLGRSSYHFPAAEPERVWLVEGTMAGEARNRVREVTIDGETTVERREVPSGTLPLAAVSAGLVLLDGERLRIWDPSEGDEVAVLDGTAVLDAKGDRLAWCESPCETLRVTDFAEGWEGELSASAAAEGIEGWDHGRAALSPGGDRLAAHAVSAASEPGQDTHSTDAVALIEVGDGQAEVASIVESGVAVDGRPIWTQRGDWLLVPLEGGEMLAAEVEADSWGRIDVGLPASLGLVAIDRYPAVLSGFGGDRSLGPRRADGLVLSISEAGSGQVRAVNPSAGSVEWTRDVGEQASLGPADEGRVLASADEEVIALEVRTGAVEWAIALEEGQRAGTAAVAGGMAYLPISYPGEGDTRAPRVRLVEVSSGDTAWEARLEEGADLQWAPPVVTEDRVLVADTPSHPGSGAVNRLHGLDRETGDVAWSFDLGTEQQGFHDTPPLVDGERVFAVSPGGGLFGIDADSGTELWQRRFVGLPRLGGVTEGRLEVHAEGERLELDPATGDRLD